MNDKDKIISAFAFKTGQEIEKLIKEQTENLEGRNRILEAMIMQWYMKSKDKTFAKHFGISEMREGTI